MIVDEFLDFLDSAELGYYTNDKSIVLQESPCCNTEYKIFLFKTETSTKPLFGKCMKCETKWSSKSYMFATGAEQAEVDKVHGAADPSSMADIIQGGMPDIDLEKTTDGAEEGEEEEPPIFDLSGFISVTLRPNHPVAKYAVKRGWTKEWDEEILIDPLSSSVIFLCREEGRVVGYQRRFLRPPSPDRKTKTVPGFKKTKHILQFPSNGPVMVCEGPFTALSAWHYGYHGVCTFGSSVSNTQLDKIASLVDQKRHNYVAVSYDQDIAGRRGYKAIYLYMRKYANLRVYRAKPEKGNDLNDSWQEGYGVELIEEDLDTSLPDLEIDEIV